MKEKLEKIKAEAIRQINMSDALDKLNDVRVNFLGKKGELTAVLKSMKEVAPEDRPKVGQLVNEAREEIERVLEEAKAGMEKKLREAKMKAEVIDVTLPAQKNSVGHRHPNTIALEEVERIFIGMGYEVVEGPEIEKDYYNFEALNIPADHIRGFEGNACGVCKGAVRRGYEGEIQTAPFPVHRAFGRDGRFVF